MVQLRGYWGGALLSSLAILSFFSSLHFGKRYWSLDFELGGRVDGTGESFFSGGR